MDVSVIVPFYNSEVWLEACIQALLKQTYSEGGCEYLLVDNGSTDGSAAVARHYPAVRLLSETKRGAYTARNRGLREACGEIIAFTDSDCVPRSDWLEQIVRIMRDPDVDIVVGQLLFPAASHTMQLMADYEAEKMSYILSVGARELHYGYGGNMAVRKSLTDAVGPFLEVLRGVDTILVRQAVNQFGRGIVRYAPDVRVVNQEMTSIWKWFRKMVIYGRSHQNYRRIVPSRSLSNGQRLEIVKRLAATNNLSSGDYMKLSVILAVGLLHWHAGRLSGRFAMCDHVSLV